MIEKVLPSSLRSPISGGSSRGVNQAGGSGTIEPAPSAASNGAVFVVPVPFSVSNDAGDRSRE